jgi:enoyl-CoA hydratase/carnithine racemase
MADVLYEKREHIAYITLNRPEKLNAQSDDLLSGLESALGDLRDDPELKVGIVTGAGHKAFSTGGDLEMISKLSGSFKFREERFWKTFARSPICFREMGTVWKPLIAAVNGYCLAGGLELALACDIIIASDNATFGIPEVTLGAIPSAGGTQRLIRRVPFGMALEIMLTGESITAQEAYRIGLVNKVVPLAELMSAAEKLAKKIADSPLHALMVLKELAWRGGLCMSFTEGLRMEKVYSRILREDEEQKERMEAALKRIQKKQKRKG